MNPETTTKLLSEIRDQISDIKDILGDTIRLTKPKDINIPSGWTYTQMHNLPLPFSAVQSIRIEAYFRRDSLMWMMKDYYGELLFMKRFAIIWEDK